MRLSSAVRQISEDDLITRPARRLIPRTADEHAVAAGWERFIRNEPLPEIPIRSVVLESRRRCRSDGVDPACSSAPAVADGMQIEQLRDRHRHLYDAALPMLEMLREVLRESGTVIMLTDPAGTILDIYGDSQTRQVAELVNLAPGGCWHEELIGTNAIGTAIAALEPVQIYGSEHYCFEVKRWTCAAVPILDPSSRALLGVVNVSGIKETFHGHSLGLVLTAAKQIESVLTHRNLELRGRLLEQSMDVFARFGGDCVILFDQRGHLLKSNGRIQCAQKVQSALFPLKVGDQVGALNLTLPAEERSRRFPAWLKREWVHTVGASDEELGTALIIPVAHPAPRAPQNPVTIPAQKTGSDPFGNIIGSSEAIFAAKAKARRLALLDLPVMLLGETGVGKEVFASAIHKAGARPDAPFIAVNCGAFTREFLASELFGYAEGAYTGARRGGLAGKFELADGGTLFLDEIGEMPIDMQPHLLRVLQNGIVVRLGDTRERVVSVRIIAATNRDLHCDVLAGRFRTDLYHRLCVISLRLPALRERSDDIDALIADMNARLSHKYHCAPKTIAPQVRQALLCYAWPGNIRELKNVFEAMFALSEGDFIDASQLPLEISSTAAESAYHGTPQPMRASGGLLQDMERQAVKIAVANAHGNRSMAGRTLGISRSTLYVKLARMAPDS
jgi:transcriptional regulator of acetoin/glycerol metabolism